MARRSPEGEKDRREVPWGIAFDMSVEVEDVVEAMEEVDAAGEAVGGDTGFVSSW